MKKHALRYTMTQPEVGAFTEKDVTGDSQGLCDAFVFGSMNKTESGGLSVLWMGCDGRSGKLEDITPIETFKAWLLLAAQLESTLPANCWQKEFVAAVRTHVREVLKVGNDNKPEVKG